MNKLRKIVQKTGFDFHRHYPTVNKLTSVQNRNIKTVLDIGANTGQFAAEIRSILPEVDIYSFEPIAESFETLKKNMLGDKHFKAFHFALGEKNEEIEMEKNEYSPSSSILPLAESHKNLFPHARKVSKEKITIQRLDDIAPSLQLKTEILIKVDVQGFEDKVISGGQQTFSKAKVLILETSFMELYRDQPTFDTIYTQLKNLGFSYHGSLQEKVGKDGTIISEDSVFVKK